MRATSAGSAGAFIGVAAVKPAGPIFLVAALLALATVAFGCAGPLRQWGEEVSLVSVSPSFDPQTLTRARVVVLNGVVGFGLEGYAVQVSRSLSQVLGENDLGLNVGPAQQAMSDINQQGLASPYARMMSEYIYSGILDRATLQKIGHAVGARYIALPSMAAFSQSASARLSFFGLRVFQTRISMLRLSLQLWDARSGEIVWEASGEATLANEDIREFRIPFEDIARRLWRRLLLDLKPAATEKEDDLGRAKNGPWNSARVTAGLRECGLVQCGTLAR